MEDEGSLAEAVSKVDVVISAIPSKHVLDQKLLVRVIKQAGSIKVSSYILIMDFFLLHQFDHVLSIDHIVVLFNIVLEFTFG